MTELIIAISIVSAIIVIVLFKPVCKLSCVAKAIREAKCFRDLPVGIEIHTIRNMEGHFCLHCRRHNREIICSTAFLVEYEGAFAAVANCGNQAPLKFKIRKDSGNKLLIQEITA